MYIFILNVFPKRTNENLALPHSFFRDDFFDRVRTTHMINETMMHDEVQNSATIGVALSLRDELETLYKKAPLRTTTPSSTPSPSTSIAVGGVDVLNGNVVKRTVRPETASMKSTSPPPTNAIL